MMLSWQRSLPHRVAVRHESHLDGPRAFLHRVRADIMGYYSRQTCGAMIRTVFRNVAEQLMAAQVAADMGQVRHRQGPTA